MEGVSVDRISILVYIILFILYIVLHVIIGIKKNKLDDDLKTFPNNKEIKRNVGTFTFLFKWFPFLYVIFILIFLSIV